MSRIFNLSVMASIGLVVSLTLGALFALAEGTNGAWTYKQSTGELFREVKLVGKGYSGHGKGVNNPDFEDKRDVGPIPRGEWSIGDAFKHDKLGPVAMRLTPVGHKAHGRDSFLIHGDNNKGDRSASNGCIILSRDLREQISKGGIKRLMVVK